MRPIGQEHRKEVDRLPLLLGDKAKLLSSLALTPRHCNTVIDLSHQSQAIVPSTKFEGATVAELTPCVQLCSSADMELSTGLLLDEMQHSEQQQLM